MNSPAVGVEHVCLEKKREANETDEQKQIQRRNFYTSLATFGANCCKAKLVWRAIDAYDYTCVEPYRHEIAHAEIDRQDERISLTGVGCNEPYMARNAFPGDRV